MGRCVTGSLPRSSSRWRSPASPPPRRSLARRAARSSRAGTTGPARRPAPRHAELGHDHRLARAHGPHARGLRLRALEREPDRHPGDDREREHPALVRHVRLHGGERPGPVPDPRRRPDRGRERPARHPRRPRRLHALRALRARADAGCLACGLRRDLEPPLERDAPGGLDVRRRRRPPDPPRTRALRRGRAGAHRPRAPLHRVADEARLHLARPPLRELVDGPGPTADGAAGAPQGGLRHLGLPAAVARRAPGLEGSTG